MKRHLRTWAVVAAALLGCVPSLASAGAAPSSSSSSSVTELPPPPSHLLADRTGPEALQGSEHHTPTEAPGKVCPFTGDIPVTLPVVASPVGTSVPGTAGLNLSEPSVPSHIYGELCLSERSLQAARTGDPPAVLVLVHGITYGTYYWDFPYQPEKYSAVNHLNERGYATLNIDRIGIGRSDHPASALTTTAVQADTIHQLITKLRSGEIGGIGFENVGTVGHSYGTVVTWFEAALFDDVDTVIGTGYSDRVSALNAINLIATASPASTVDKTADEPWAADPGYLQVRPNTRAIPELYNVSNADDRVIAVDNRLANTVTVEELATFPEPEYDGMHKNIREPTFLINGEYDNLTCGADQRHCATDATTTGGPADLERAGQALQTWEGPAHHPEACFRAAVIPEMAHDVNLHDNAEQTFAQIAYFADQSMGPNGENVASYRTTCQTREANLSDQLPETGRLVPPFPIDGIG